MDCPNCKKKMVKNGKRRNLQYFICKKCGISKSEGEFGKPGSPPFWHSESQRWRYNYFRQTRPNDPFAWLMLRTDSIEQTEQIIAQIKQALAGKQTVSYQHVKKANKLAKKFNCEPWEKLCEVLGIPDFPLVKDSSPKPINH